MSKLFLKTPTTLGPKQGKVHSGFLKLATAKELDEFIVLSKEALDGKYNAIIADSNVIADGHTLMHSLEKIAALAKVTCEDHGRGFTPMEVTLVNQAIEGISMMAGAPTSLLTLDSRAFGTESIAKDATQELVTLSSEGFLDVVKKVGSAIQNSASRLLATIKEFFIFAIKLHNKHQAIHASLLERLAAAKEAGKTEPGESVGNKSLVKVRVAMVDNNLVKFLRERYASGMEYIRAGSATVQLSDAGEGSTPKEYAKPLVDAELKTQLKDMKANPAIGREVLGNESDTWTVYTGKPISIDGRVGWFAVHNELVDAVKGTSHEAVDALPDKFIKHGITDSPFDKAKLDSAAAALIPTEVEEILSAMDLLDNDQLKNNITALEKAVKNNQKDAADFIKDIDAQIKKGGIPNGATRLKVAKSIVDGGLSVMTNISIPMVKNTLSDNALILSACLASIESYKAPAAEKESATMK